MDNFDCPGAVLGAGFLDSKISPLHFVGRFNWPVQLKEDFAVAEHLGDLASLEEFPTLKAPSTARTLCAFCGTKFIHIVSFH